MQQNSTPGLLVKHLYNETTEQESNAVRMALTDDSSLQEELTLLQEAKQALDEAGGDTPGTSVIEKILAFSKEQALTEVH